MLVVDPEKRFTIDQCLQHPWMKLETLNPNDSTNGLVNGLAELEVQRRAPHRERTLLSSLNTVQVANRVPMSKNQPDVKIHVKNPKGPKKEIGPADGRDPREFMALGGKGDQELFGHDGESFYSKDDVAKQGKKAAR